MPGDGLGIGRLVVPDAKDSSSCARQGMDDQHSGGSAHFAYDVEIMGWLFGQRKYGFEEGCKTPETLAQGVVRVCVFQRMVA